MCKILYVPVMLEGLLVGKHSAPVADLGADYATAAEIPLGKYATRVFGTKQEMSGIHLHWTMPDALLHGTHTSGDDGEIQFPDLPNRWIVQRLCVKNGEVRHKAWLIESDFVTNYPAVGLEQYGRTSVPTFQMEDGLWKGAGQNGQVYGYLGSARVYGTENQEDGYYLPNLTAAGPGDPSFAACYQKCRSVFGFYDSMEGEGEGTYDYILTGYYSDLEKDPLKGADEETLARLGWSVSDKNALPEKTVCHSILGQIEWKGADNEYPSGVPKGDIDVYVGNTSAEALSAFLQKQMPKVEGLERMLNAFQNDMLDGLEFSGNPDALLCMEEQLHRKQFESTGQQATWGLRNTGKRKNDAIIEMGHYTEIAALNDLQEEHNFLLAEIESLKDEIYFAWWKYVLAESDPWGDDKVRLIEKDDRFREDAEVAMNADSDMFLGLVREQIQKLKELKKQEQEDAEKITELQNSLNGKLQELSVELDRLSRDRFYTANPPVLLFCGDSIKRAYRQGFQYNEDDGLLHCRMNLTDSLSLTINDKKVTVTAKDAVRTCLGTVPSLPSFAEGLLGEALLLSGEFAKCVAKTAIELAELPYSPEKVEAAENDIRKKQREKTGFTGSFPDCISVCRWKQPWTPLFMEWRVQMQSSRTDICKDDSFHGYSLEEIDLELDGQGTEGTGKIEVAGATLITPHAVDNLSHLISRMAEDERQGLVYEDLKKAADIAGKMEILSQRMDGFHEALIMRDNLPALPIYHSSEKLAPLLYELTELLDQQFISPRVENLESRFFPVRAGFLSILEIWLVDAFGQIKKIRLNENNLSVGENLMYKGREKEVYLRPRFMHPATVRFRWLCSRMEEEMNVRMESVDNGTTPVFGFLVPNFLDGNIQVYGECGRLLGFIQKSGQGARWMRFFPSCIPFEEIPSAHLRFFVKGLLGDENPACMELLQYLDQLFSRSAPKGDGQFLQSCFGRTLALARGSVQVLGRGYPPHVQWFRKELVCNQFDTEKFKVRFGDKRKLSDGLAGFYKGEKKETAYQKLFVPDLFSQTKSEYIAFGSGIDLSLSDEPEELTFLFEPSGSITISTGFLPAKEVSLDKTYYQTELSAGEMYLKTAPLLSPANQIELPVPGKMAGKWKFHYINPDGNVEIQEIREPDVYFPDTRKQIREGFLTTAGDRRNQ